MTKKTIVDVLKENGFRRASDGRLVACTYSDGQQDTLSARLGCAGIPFADGRNSKTRTYEFWLTNETPEILAAFPKAA